MEGASAFNHDISYSQAWGASLKRNPTTNRFSDKDLAQTLQNATDDMAQAFRARGIPAAFKVIEVMGIKQARAWNVCSLNEFRKFLGLKRGDTSFYKDFASFSSLFS